MKTIMILGGYGQTGRLLARHLLEKTDAAIILAGRHLEKARRLELELNNSFKGQRVSSRVADAASPSSLRDALNGIDFLLVASPTTQVADNVIHAALEAKVDYLDVQLDARKLAILNSMKPEIEQSGLCFITEAGFHPGLPSAMVRYANTCLEKLDSVNMAGYLNMGHDLPYTESVDELMEVFKHYQAQVFQNGKWKSPGSFTMRKFEFGHGIGKKNCYSMYFEELHDLPALIPSLKEIGFYMSESNWLVDWLLTPIIFLGLKLAPKKGMRPLGKIMWWGMRNFNKPPYLVLLKADAAGEKDGHPVKLELEISHPDGYELTAIPVVACMMQVLDGSARKSGLWMMGHLVDPVRLMKDMQEMGISVEFRLA